MNRVLVLSASTVLLAAISGSMFAFRADAGRRPQAVTLRLGDVVRVAGTADVGCKVRTHDGAPTLDCRRAGPLTGTFGAMLNRNEVLVVRFESAKTAKIVFSGQQTTGTFARCKAAP
jgi:hypothetical protein